MIATGLSVTAIAANPEHPSSERLAEIADFMVRIPMRGGCDSINVSVAAGVPAIRDFQPAAGQLDFPSIGVGRRGWIGQGCESS